jgi:hypothetical protein
MLPKHRKPFSYLIDQHAAIMNEHSSNTPSNPAVHLPDHAYQWLSRLGYAGLLPFMALSALLWLVDADAATFVSLGLVAYAALIVAFLGGIYWGAVWHMYASSVQVNFLFKPALLWAVVSTCLAWVGLLMPAFAALPWLGFLLILCYAVDRQLYPNLGLQRILTLRFRLSAIAALCCLLGAGAI